MGRIMKFTMYSLRLFIAFLVVTQFTSSHVSYLMLVIIELILLAIALYILFLMKVDQS